MIRVAAIGDLHVGDDCVVAPPMKASISDDEDTRMSRATAYVPGPR